MKKTICLMLFPAMLWAQSNSDAVIYVMLLGPVFAVVWAGYEIAYPFKMMFPPLDPPRGRWETSGPARERRQLRFDGDYAYEGGRAGEWEKTRGGAKIHWQGGAVWEVRVRRKHLEVNDGGKVVKFHYAPAAP